jgi:hypothetical protein
VKHVQGNVRNSKTHIRAVFTAASRLDVHKGTHLDRGGIVEFPVNCALITVNGYSKWPVQITHSCKSQLHQGSIIDLLDFFFGPIVPWSIGLESTFKNSRLRGRPSRNGGDSAILSHKRLRFGLLEQGSTARSEESGSMATHGIVGESIDSRKLSVVDCIWEDGYSMVGGHSAAHLGTGDGLSLGGHHP